MLDAAAGAVPLGALHHGMPVGIAMSEQCSHADGQFQAVCWLAGAVWLPFGLHYGAGAGVSASLLTAPQLGIDPLPFRCSAMMLRQTQ